MKLLAGTNIHLLHLYNSPASAPRRAVWWLTKSLGSGARWLSKALGCYFNVHVENRHKCPLSFRLQSLVFEESSILAHLLLQWLYSFLVLSMAPVFLYPINNISPAWDQLSPAALPLILRWGLDQLDIHKTIALQPDRTDRRFL